MALKLHHQKRWIAVTGEALTKGAVRTSALTTKWNAAGNCSSPVYREMTGAPAIRQVLQSDRVLERGPLHILELEVRCRKCENCRKAHAFHWRKRAESEFALAKRNWFGTLTLRPDEHYRTASAVRLRLSARGVSFDDMSEPDQFRELVDEVGKEVTLWLKRLRKNTGAKLRYLLVAERHKSGLPHFHLLVHEMNGTVSYAALRSAWRLGFSHFKLVTETKTAAYVCKYLSKDAGARVRASLRYGKTT